MTGSPKVLPSAARKAEAAGPDDVIDLRLRLTGPQLPPADVAELARVGCSWLVQTLFLAGVRVPAKSLAAVAALGSVAEVH